MRIFKCIKIEKNKYLIFIVNSQKFSSFHKNLGQNIYIYIIKFIKIQIIHEKVINLLIINVHLQ
jgi:hypothetical protein